LLLRPQTGFAMAQPQPAQVSERIRLSLNVFR
jgi:hypothetical protein